MFICFQRLYNDQKVITKGVILFIAILLTCSVSVSAKQPPKVRGILNGMLLFCWDNGQLITANKCPMNIEEISIVLPRNGPLKLASWSTEISPSPSVTKQQMPCGNIRSAVHRKGPVIHDMKRHMNKLDSKAGRFKKMLGKQIGIENPDITKIFRVDLNGDGIKEVLFEVNSHHEFLVSGPASIHSIVGVRKIVGSKISTVFLHNQRISVPAGKQKKDWVRGSLDGLTDIDGDENLEVVLSTENHRFAQTKVVAIHKETSQVIGENGCGLPVDD